MLKSQYGDKEMETAEEMLVNYGMEKGEQKGMQKGMRQGLQQGRSEMANAFRQAKGMLGQQIAPEEIMRQTGLTRELLSLIQ